MQQGGELLTHEVQGQLQKQLQLTLDKFTDLGISGQKHLRGHLI